MTKITLIYDPELRRPGCVLIQAMAGLSYQPLYQFFESKDWLTSPTPGMRRISGTGDEWKRAAGLEVGK